MEIPVDREMAQAGAPFLAGNRDAAGVGEPRRTPAAERGNGYVLAPASGHRNLIVDCLAFDAAVVRTMPDDVQRTVNAPLKTIVFIQQKDK
jgi:ABC-type nitrate/sulfonate/bicarbonate transport system substrate-binding protein